MQDFAPFIPELLGAPGHKGRRACINLPATFQFSPATSKSIDIPVTFTNYITQKSQWERMLEQNQKGGQFNNKITLTVCLLSIYPHVV
jgi:hypothetical protein